MTWRLHSGRTLYSTGSPICLILPSWSCLSCLCFHLIFAVEIFLFIRRRSAPDRLPYWRRLLRANFTSSGSFDTWQFDLGLFVSLIYKLYRPSYVCGPRFSQSKDWSQYFSIIVISCIVFIQYFSLNDLKYVIWPLLMKVYCYEGVLLPAIWNHLLLQYVIEILVYL